MHALIDRILAAYAESDLHLQLKARFFLYVCLVLPVVMGIIMAYTMYVVLSSSQSLSVPVNPLVAVEAACLAIALSALILLIRGHFSTSAHLVLIDILITNWAVVIFDHSHVVSRLDSFVLSVCSLGLLPLIVKRHARAVILYGLFSVLFLLAFFYLFRGELDMPDYAVIDYLADNGMAVAIACFISYSLFTINRKAMDRAKEEITERTHAEAIIQRQKSRLEETNQELSYTLEQMEVTTREYEEANTHLIEAQAEALNANRLLRESEERFSKAFRLNPLPAVLLTDEEERFVDVSDSFCSAMGYDRGEIIGEQAKDLALWNDARDFDRIKDLIAGRSSVREEEFVVRSRSGDAIALLVSAGVIFIGQAKHIIIMGVDITGRKQAEEEKANLEAQLRQAQKMESIGRLAGGVAHDFNNLLTAILGNASLASMDLPHGSPAHSRLSSLIRAGESAADLTRQLLAFSRKQIIEPRPVSIHGLIETMHSMLARLIGEDIRLEIVSEGSTGTINADPGQIEQIVVNLVVNARDAMPDGGRLVLKTASVRVDREHTARHPYITPGSYLMLSVSDTGMGMTPEVKQHLFEPFFTTKPLGKGTGLGLATVYGAVKQNGGYIDVYSEQGSGTTFRILFPLMGEGAAEMQEQAPARTLVQGSETILLVEDDPLVLDYALNILGHLGYTALPAGTGKEAVAIAGSHPGEIHLLLTDVILPDTNGRALSEKVRLIRPGLRVLFTSGYTEEIIDHHGILEEGIQFIGKPYSSQAIADKVREVLES